MKKFLKVNLVLFFILFIFCLSIDPLWADPGDWSFLPASTIFKPLIGDPREPITGLVGYVDQLNSNGQVASTMELIRYSPDDDTQYAWGIFASAYILLGENGAVFPMQDGDFYVGTYFSANLGVFSARLEALHESTHLGDSLQYIQTPLIYLGTTNNYSRENVNGTISLQLSDSFRIYAGLGAWDFPIIVGDTNTLFTSLGTEIYSPYWSIDHSAMRAYLTGSLQWNCELDAWNKEIQLGFQWKAFKSSNRAIRTAILFYSGNNQFGQFYNSPDTHWALATFFDF